ncbi:hypothetical protein FB451DRAFT_1556375 [Mycena latifolia]|nr:hypothetical protein FB451DRAFT_1556375 [Mycena latifolia]
MATFLQRELLSFCCRTITAPSSVNPPFCSSLSLMLSDLQTGERFTNTDFIFYDCCIAIDCNFKDEYEYAPALETLDYDDMPGLEDPEPCPRHCRICFPRLAKL